VTSRAGLINLSDCFFPAFLREANASRDDMNKSEEKVYLEQSSLAFYAEQVALQFDGGARDTTFEGC